MLLVLIALLKGLSSVFFYFFGSMFGHKPIFLQVLLLQLH